MTIRFLPSIVVALIICIPAYAVSANWTLLVYIQTDADLNAAVCKNLYDLARASADERVNVLLQIQMNGTAGLRCTIEGGKIQPVEIVSLTLNPQEDLKNGLQWAYGDYPAKHHALILGSHGFGILDPVWNDDAHDWRPEVMSDYQEACVVKKLSHNDHRGMLFDPYHQTYLNNESMVAAISQVVTTTLNNQKIDIIGMDACKMSMLEIAYQLAPYAHYIMGSQECELVDGYDYYACVNALMYQANVESAAQSMVQSYEDYYQAIASKYTQSAINTHAIAVIIDNINSIIQHLVDNSSEYAGILAKVREQRTQFCEQPSYIDVYDFYNALAEAIADSSSDTLQTLLSLLDTGKTLVAQAVVANVTGSKVPHAHGISIYYPIVYKPSSYAKCAFARDTLWIQFLETFAL